jgi:hypothetical protein
MTLHPQSYSFHSYSHFSCYELNAFSFSWATCHIFVHVDYLFSKVGHIFSPICRLSYILCPFRIMIVVFSHIVTFEKKFILGLHILLFKVMFASKNVVASMARNYLLLLTICNKKIEFILTWP